MKQCACGAPLDYAPEHVVECWACREEMTRPSQLQKVDPPTLPDVPAAPPAPFDHYFYDKRIADTLEEVLDAGARCPDCGGCFTCYCG